MQRLERLIDELSHDVSLGLKGAHTAIVFLGKRVDALEVHRNESIAKHATHEAILNERRRDGDASREHSVEIGKLLSNVDELQALTPLLMKLTARVEQLEKGGDAAEIKRAKQLGLGGAATSIAMFVATVITLVVKSLMEGQ